MTIIACPKCCTAIDISITSACSNCSFDAAIVEYGGKSLKPLVVILTKSPASMEADEALRVAASNPRKQVKVQTHDELFFHQLRLRVAENPAISNLVDVFYFQDGKFLPLGLGFDDELRWPKGFGTEGWEIEIKLNALRALAQEQGDSDV